MNHLHPTPNTVEQVINRIKQLLDFRMIKAYKKSKLIMKLRNNAGVEALTLKEEVQSLDSEIEALGFEIVELENSLRVKNKSRGLEEVRQVIKRIFLEKGSIGADEEEILMLEESLADEDYSHQKKDEMMKEIKELQGFIKQSVVEVKTLMDNLEIVRGLAS